MNPYILVAMLAVASLYYGVPAAVKEAKKAEHAIAAKLHHHRRPSPAPASSDPSAPAAPSDQPAGDRAKH